MAMFRFKEDVPRPKLHGKRGANGPVKELRLRLSDGTKLPIAKSDSADFSGGEEFEVTDARAIRHLKVDPRFELISE